MRKEIIEAMRRLQMTEETIFMEFDLFLTCYQLLRMSRNSAVNIVIVPLLVFRLIRYGQHFQRSVSRHLQHINRAIANTNFSTRSNRVLQATGTQQFSNLLQLRRAMVQECAFSISTRKPELHLRPVQVGFVVHNVTLGQVSPNRLLPFSPFSIIPPMLHTHISVMYQRCYKT